MAKKTNAALLEAKPEPKKSKKLDIVEYVDLQIEEGSWEELGKIQQIIKLWHNGYTRKDIITKAGFNKSTVYVQTGVYNKLKKEPVKEFCGFEMYEARIQRLMRVRKITRDEAIEAIAQKDSEQDQEVDEIG